MGIDWHSMAAWYFAIINAVAVIIYGWDKLCAIRKWWRVPELLAKCRTTELQKC